MEDPELAAIRAARLQQLQKENGKEGFQSEEQEQEAAAQRESQEEMKRNMLAAVLEAPARERRTSTTS